MRVLIILFICVFAFCTELKIATFNTENLFDVTQNGNEYKDFRDGKWNNAKYSHKLNQISNVIKSINADVIALQEIENEGVLKDLAIKSGYKYFKFAISDKNSPFGLGFLSKKPIVSSKIFNVNGVKTRPILMIEIAFAKENIKLFTAHLPAQKNSLKYRKIAADTLINAAKGEKHAVILGDLNSDFGYGFLLNELNGEFKNMWEFLNSWQRKSHVRGSAIDHIMLSNDFFSGGDLIYKKNSFSVYDKSSASDHYPIYVVILDEQKMQNLQLKNINEIYKPSREPSRIIGVLIYRDDKGFVLSDENRRGIYVFTDKKLPLGTKIDMSVFETKEYKGNLEITNFDINSVQTGAHENLKDFMLSSSDLSMARSGDVLHSVSLELKDGYAYINSQKFKIYSKFRSLKDGIYDFKNVLVWSYRGQKELIVE